MNDSFEEALRLQGYSSIAGVDEAGRGPLAGPVVAAACILPSGFSHLDLNDSKQLTPLKRSAIYRTLLSTPGLFFSLGIVSSEIIDEINILQASLKAMAEAIAFLPTIPDYLLVDGIHLPKTSIRGVAIIEGDAKIASIAAASVIAKETRDSLMREFDVKWPEYGFAKHKGYGTKHHLETLKKYGPCPIHRMSFAPVKLNLTPGL